MKKYGLNELRQMYLEFFESKGHLRLPSFPLIPQGDSSLLLINAGMAPLKPYFTGEVTPPRTRVTTCQKCIRTPDIERVGKTSRHGTFFEMLGNFSFGDYFKHEATAWAWEFITKVLEMPVDKLYVSVYQDDDEAFDIWTKEIGVAEDHMVRLGKEDNFWEIGSGPCGPCSEIYFDRGVEHGCGSPDCAVGCDCDRFIEFWNLVFTQFNNDGEGNYTQLASKNIDTGMGLERLACIMQGVESLFDVDTVMNITHHVSRLTGATYGQTAEKDVSLRVITDHIRSTTMMICDGVLPSNEGRGYVLRRLLRRAARHGKLLGMKGAFLYEVCETVINESREAYPELEEKRDYIVRIIKAEEERFDQTIDAGLHILEGHIEALKAEGKTKLEGADCFKLYDTYGFPIDLTLEILADNGMEADTEGFDVLMKEQRERARAATAALGDFGWAGLDLGLDKSIPTEFTGYDCLEGEGKVLAIVCEGELRASVVAGSEAVIVLDKTPFYAEMGGQIADTGVITAGESVFVVEDVQKTKDGKYMHTGRVQAGEFKVDGVVTASVDTDRRAAIMRAHSATHLLHSALRQVLGSHVEQAGSLVEPDHLRFDFTHFSPMSAEEIAKVADIVNTFILAGHDICTNEMSITEAKKMGATALFGEKYGDEVRVVSMGDVSMELCGGTHLKNTAMAGTFRIVSEFSVAAGVRRIEAITGRACLEQMDKNLKVIANVADTLKSLPEDVEEKAKQFAAEVKELRRKLEKFRQSELDEMAVELLAKAEVIGGIKVFAVKADVNGADELRKLGDLLRAREENLAAVIAFSDGAKVSFNAVCGKAAVKAGLKAGELVKTVCTAAGGSGGGKPDSAMGGGKDPALMDAALATVAPFVTEKLG